MPARDVVLAMMLGIGVDRVLSLPLVVWSWMLFAFCCAAGLTFFVERFFAAVARCARTAALLAMFAGLAGLWHHLQFSSFPEDDIGLHATREGRPSYVEGIVRTLPRTMLPSESNATPFQRGPRTVFVLDVSAICVTSKGTQNATQSTSHSAWQTMSGRVRVIIDGECESLMVGDRIRCLGELMRVAPPANYGEFDQATRLRAERILAALHVSTPEAVTCEAVGDASWSRWLAERRKKVEETFHATMSPRGAVLASAMLLGFRDGLEEEMHSALVETGTIHLLAISGLHLGLAAAAVAYFLSWCRLPREVVIAVTVAATIAYLAMTDIRPPAIRAATLIVVVAIVSLLRLKTISVNTLAVSAIVVLAINPTEMFQFGTHLSFVATGVFLWCLTLPPWRTPLSPRKYPILARTTSVALGWGRRVARLFVISFLIWIVLAPLIASQIHIVTPIAVVINPILIVPLTCSLLLGLATMLASFVCPLLTFPLGAMASWCFETLDSIVMFSHSVPFGYFWTSGIVNWLLILFYVPLVFWTLFPAWRPSQRVLWYGFFAWICLCGATFVVTKYARWFSGCAEITVASVGHGLATVIISPDGRSLVFDAGCLSSPRRAADIVSQRLWRAGLCRIDTLVISHPDFDHYSAVPILLERFAVGEVLVPPGMWQKDDDALRSLADTFKRHKVSIRSVTAGDKLVSSSALVDATFLHPPSSWRDATETMRSNEQSLVMLLRYCGRQILFAGDLDLAAPPFIGTPLASPLDVMQLPHHGGYSASTEPLWTWGHPQSVIVSGGSFVRNEAYIDSLRKRCNIIDDTFRDGAIDLTIKHDGTIVRKRYEMVAP
ncbi:MAG: ComEC/Rec2 family competence protein [Thermoguttaceae bacterium]